MIGASFVRGHIRRRVAMFDKARLDKVCLDLITADIGEYDIVNLHARLHRLTGLFDHFAIVVRIVDDVFVFVLQPYLAKMARTPLLHPQTGFM